MKKLLCFSILLSISSAALADYQANVTIGRVFIANDGHVSFGTTPQAPNTCNYYNVQFTFDSTTDGGKSMLSLLLSARMANTKIDVWYTASTLPGTDWTTGCNGSKMATATLVGLP